MKKLKIGTVGISYPHKKNFIGLNIDKVTYSRAYDLLTPYRFSLRIPVIKKIFKSRKFQNLYIDFGLNNFDLIHLRNGVSITNKPWISSFETSLPRWGFTNFGLALLAKKSCKKIIAQSECARQIQLKSIQEKFPQYFEIIQKKLVVIHPYQHQNIIEWNDKGISLKGKIRLGLIGNDFFRKGGAEVLEVFDELIENGHDLELIIVSSLQIGDYASQAGIKQLQLALDIVKKYPNKILHYQNLPQAEVFDIMKSCHVGLLPTYADTYGYSVLEFQSFACPVISTNIRALPEINNSEKGWIIEVPKDIYGEGFYRNSEDRKLLSTIIKDKLKDYILEIIYKPELIKIKGEKGLLDLERLNCPKKNADKLMDIYQEAIQNLE